MPMEGMAEAAQGLATDLSDAREGDAILRDTNEALAADDALEAAPDFDGALSEAGFMGDTEPDQEGGIDWWDEVQAAQSGEQSIFDELSDDATEAIAAVLNEGGDPSELFDFDSAPEPEPGSALTVEDLSDEEYSGFVEEFDGDAEAAAQHFNETSQVAAEIMQEDGPEASADFQQLVADVGAPMFEEIVGEAETIAKNFEEQGMEEDDALELTSVFMTAAFNSGDLEQGLEFLNRYIEASNKVSDTEAFAEPTFTTGDSDATNGPGGLPQLSKQTVAGIANGNPRDRLRAEVMGFTRTYADVQARKRADAAPPAL